jgi:hypothetical protein
VSDVRDDKSPDTAMSLHFDFSAHAVPSPDLTLIRQIQAWVIELKKLAEEDRVLVKQVECFDADCPGCEVVIGIFRANGSHEKHRFGRTLGELTHAELQKAFQC